MRPGRTRARHRRTAHEADCSAARLGGSRAAALLAVGGVSLVGTGAIAAWQASDQVTSGKVGAAEAAVELLDASGSSFAADLPDLLPGDWFFRYVDVRNSGSTDSALTGSLAVAGGLVGHLEAAADRCSVAWTTVAGASTCTGTTTPVLTARTLPGGGVTVPLGTVAPGVAHDVHLRYRFVLAPDAPESLMGAVSTVTLGVTGPATGGRDRTSP